MEAYAPIRVVTGGGSSRMEAYAPIRLVIGGGSSRMEAYAPIRVVTEPDRISISAFFNGVDQLLTFEARPIPPRVEEEQRQAWRRDAGAPPFGDSYMLSCGFLFIKHHC